MAKQIKARTTLAPEKKVFFTGLLSKDKKYFLENLSILVSAGIDIVSAVKSIGEEVSSKRMQKIIFNIALKLENGETFWRALTATNIFPNRIISLVRVGEESGRLTENLQVIVVQMGKEWELASKIRTAMLYPAIVLPITFMVGLGTAWFTLPKLAETFQQINVPLPFLTRTLISLGNFLAVYGFVLVPFIAFLFLSLIYFLFSFPKTKYLGYILLSRMPIIKNLVQFVELSRLGQMVSGLLESGISVVNAFQSLAEATTFRNYRNFYLYLSENLKNGNSFKKSFEQNKKTYKYIPRSVQNMLTTAERSGKLVEVLRHAGNIYELKTETVVKNFSTIIEPLLLIIVGILVGAIVFAIMTPIYSLVQIF